MPMLRPCMVLESLIGAEQILDAPVMPCEDDLMYSELADELFDVVCTASVGVLC